MPRATRKRKATRVKSKRAQRVQRVKTQRVKTQRVKTQRVKTKKTKRQQGGFYPSVFEGVRNASILMPLVLRQGYRMFSDTRKSKKTK